MTQIISMESWIIIISIICILILIESLIFILVNFVRKNFQWLITNKDEFPKFSQRDLEKFFPNGFDSELGWVRKPNTNKIEKNGNKQTTWNINSIGSRINPNFEKYDSLISCYGDSFTFARQVNDDETWEHYLSKYLKTNVLNFGVGNHGIDQSLLRLKREFPKNNTPIVILAVVPDTISRILSTWKHYYEYGNTFAFKPRFIIKNSELILIKNPINKESKFTIYQNYLKEIQKNDFFYKNKFKKEKLKFPYSFSILKNPHRNFSIIWWVCVIQFFHLIKLDTSKIDWNPMRIIMKINLQWRVKLFSDENTITLLQKIIEDFVTYSKNENFIPVFIFLPQKDDVIFTKNYFNFYNKFEKSLLKIKDLVYVDIMKSLQNIPNLDEFYSDKNEYGGHYSQLGNKKISEIILNDLNNFESIKKILSNSKN